MKKEELIRQELKEPLTEDELERIKQESLEWREKQKSIETPASKTGKGLTLEEKRPVLTQQAQAVLLPVTIKPSKENIAAYAAYREAEGRAFNKVQRESIAKARAEIAAAMFKMRTCNYAHCPIPGKLYKPTKRNQKYHSNSCAQKAARQRRKLRSQE